MNLEREVNILPLPIVTYDNAENTSLTVLFQQHFSESDVINLKPLLSKISYIIL